MIQLWSAVAVALLTVVVGPLLRGEVSGKLPKRIKAHAELRDLLGDNEPGKEKLDELLTFEVAALNDRERHRLTRKLNGSNLAALIFVAIVGGGCVYGLVAWAVAVSPTVTWGAVVLYGLALAAGFFTIGLAAVGLGTLYEPPETEVEKAAKKAAKAAKKASRA